MKRFVEVKQSNHKDCGPSCLQSIIKYYGGYVSHEELCLLLKTDNNGTNAYNLINGAKDLGFDGYGIHYSYEEIINNEISFPIITHILVNNMYHFVVIYEVNNKKNYLYIMDPSIGNTKISFEYFKSVYQGSAVVIYPVKKIDKTDKIIKVNDFIKTYTRFFIKDIVAIFILSLMIVFLTLLSNYYLKVIIDIVIPNYFYRYLIMISFVFLNVILIKSLLSYVRNTYLIYITNKIAIKFNNETIRHIFNLPYQFFKNKSTGEVISRLTDINKLKDIMSNLIVNILLDSILIIISMIMLLIINANLFIITFILLIIYALFVFYYSNRLKSRINDYLVSTSEYNKSLTEAIEGYESNKNINMINNVNKIIETKYIIHSKKSYRYSLLLNRLNYFKDIIMGLNYILLILVGTVFINDGTITLGNFILFITISNYFIEPINNMIELKPNYEYIKTIYSRITDLIIMKSNSVSETDSLIKGNIEFKNIYYSYDNIKYAFENISLKINYGSKYLIYGESGSGKSTLIKLLLKYMDDYKGNILIDGINIHDIDTSIISSLFTYVSQNSYLNYDTLKNNIIYGRNISDKEYEKIINICNLNKLRDSKALRNNFMIEDNGFNVSGGERQKIVLARSLLKKSNYIILDEALSEVGFKEEKEILNKIINCYKDKTIIYVSHKKEIISLFDNKYYLERIRLW